MGQDGEVTVEFTSKGFSSLKAELAGINNSLRDIINANKHMKKNTDEIKKQVKEVRDLKKHLKGARRTMVKMRTTTLALAAAFGLTFGSIFGKFMQMSGLSSIFDAITSSMAAVLAIGFAEEIGKLANWVASKAVPAMMAFAKELSMQDGIGGKMQFLSDKFREWTGIDLAAMWNGLVKALQALKPIFDGVLNVITWVGEKLGILNSEGGKVAGTFGVIGQVIGAVFTVGVITTFIKVLKGVLTVAKGVMSAFKGIAKLVGAVAKGAGKVTGKLGGKSLGKLVPGLGLGLAGYDTFKNVKNGTVGDDPLGMALSGATIGATIGSVVPGVGTLVGGVVGGGIGLGTSFLGRKFGFAHGGIVNRPTNALIGERGPEAVIPLHRLGEMMNGGGTTSNTYNLTVNQYGGDSGANLFSQFKGMTGYSS